jgi:heptosyltransferase-2
MMKKILVVKSRAMGDAIMGLGTIQFLKSYFPQSEIHYAIPKWIAPLLESVQTAADKIIAFDLKSPLDFYDQWIFLAQQKYDHIFELHQTGRNAKFFSTYALFHKTTYSFHNHQQTAHVRGPLIQRDLDGVFVYLTKKMKIEKPDFLNFSPLMKCQNVVPMNAIVFGVVATRKTKMWPLSYYQQLAEKISQQQKTKILIPLSLSDEDQHIKEKILQWQNPLVEVIQVSTGQLAQRIAPASFYVGNDTGLKHLCVALGIKTLTFFGPEEPLEWHPYAKTKHDFLFIDPLPCRTEISHYCPLKTCDSMICLNQFLPKDVWEKNLKKELESPRHR